MREIIHKADYKNKVSHYLGFGSYEQVPTTICRGTKGYYSTKNLVRGKIVRNWKHVTCKKCLARKPKK